MDAGQYWRGQGKASSLGLHRHPLILYLFLVVTHVGEVACDYMELISGTTKSRLSQEMTLKMD